MKIELYPKPQLELLWENEYAKCQGADAPLPTCLRCGATMHPTLVDNALSRHASIYICNNCGVDESRRDLMHKPLPFSQWYAAKEMTLPDIDTSGTALLKTECSFKHIFETIKPAPHSSHGRPASELVYSRSDYDGYRWYTSWFECQIEKPSPPLVKEIDAFTEAFFSLPEMCNLEAMKRLCAYAAPTSDDTEYDFFSETTHFHIWIAMITRSKDYNLYIHYYLK